MTSPKRHGSHAVHAVSDLAFHFLGFYRSLAPPRLDALWYPRSRLCAPNRENHGVPGSELHVRCSTVGLCGLCPSRSCVSALRLRSTPSAATTPPPARCACSWSSDREGWLAGSHHPRTPFSRIRAPAGALPSERRAFAGRRATDADAQGRGGAGGRAGAGSPDPRGLRGPLDGRAGGCCDVGGFGPSLPPN